jgi:hypothetical protein
MNPYLIAQIEQDNHARMQQAYTYCNAANAQAEHQARAQFAAQSRFAAQSQRQQPSGYAETSKYPIAFQSCSDVLDPDPDHKTNQLIVPDSKDDRRTRRSFRTAQRDTDPAEDMRAKLACMNMMSGGLGDCDEAPRRSSRRDGESTYRASESARRPRDRDEPSLYSRRGGESSRRPSEPFRYDDEPSRGSSRRDGGGESSYRASEARSRRAGASDHDLSDYRAESVARAPTLRSARPSERERKHHPTRNYAIPGGMGHEEMRSFRESAREQAHQDRAASGRSCAAEMDPYGEFGGRRSRYY